MKKKTQTHAYTSLKKKKKIRVHILLRGDRLLLSFFFLLYITKFDDVFVVPIVYSYIHTILFYIALR